MPGSSQIPERQTQRTDLHMKTADLDAMTLIMKLYQDILKVYPAYQKLSL